MACIRIVPRAVRWLGAVATIAAALIPATARPARLAAATPRARAARLTPGASIVRGVRATRAVLPAALAGALRQARIPSFSRQTGLPCAACHYQFPQLTPFGRLFKLNGYTLTGLKVITSGGDTTRRQTLALAPIPPASAMIVASLTHTRRAPPGTQNDAASFPQEASLFLGGEVTPRIGAFTQLTYGAADGGIGIDNIDLRFASHHTMGSGELLYGITLHNNPTVQDVWNTTPAWSFPFMASEAAPAPIAGTIIDGALGQQVLGLGAYGLWNDLLYTELTAYRSAPQGTSAPDSTASGIARGVIPYWRVALQHQLGGAYVMIGTYGLDATLYTAGVSGPTDRYTDVAADAQVEHPLHETGVLLLRGTFIHERQRLGGLLAAAPAGAVSASSSLETLRASATLEPGALLGLTAAFFRTSGGADSLRYAPGPVFGSASGSPNSAGLIGEVTVNPWQNTRVAAQYVAYTRFNGARRDYDAAGRSAADNDVLYVYTWIAF